MINKDVEFSLSELSDQANGLLNTFFQRRDLYARQLEDGHYICVHQPLTPDIVIAHLEGKITLGAYVLDQNSLARFVVLDGDDDTQFMALISLRADLAKSNIPSYLEASRRGGHLWLFLSEPTYGEQARSFGLELARRVGLSGIEIFPKQNRLTGGPGSLIRLPFGIHQRTGIRYGFLDSSLQPLARTLADQIHILTHPKTVHPAELTAKEPIHPIEAPIPHSVLRKLDKNLPLSARIKNSISVRDFVEVYVGLSPSGHGLCPFHADKIDSFAVNTEGNYWNCFAGCGGGSIIDFWMRYRKCDFTTAVRELARMLQITV